MIHLEATTCKACGLCGKICPRHLVEVVKDEGGRRSVVSPERADLCMSCGHCAAVCPTGSITVDGLDPDAFDPIAPLEVGPEQLLALLRQRRSVRRYKKRPVDREALERIVEAVHASPTGTGKSSNGVLVIERRELIEQMMKPTYAMYRKLDRALANPIARFLIKRRVDAQALRTLQRFVMPGMRWYMRWREDGKGDEISRDCQALMLFFGPSDEPMVQENCNIAAFHALLMAQVLGVGACLNHLIPPACNRLPELRALLDLSDDQEVHASVTLGYPSFKFVRAIPHRAATVRYL